MTVNAPTTNACPNHMPWMVYNQVKTCVYCIRPPSVRLEGESSTNQKLTFIRFCDIVKDILGKELKCVDKT